MTASSPTLSSIWPHLERRARAAGVRHIGACDLGDLHSETFVDWIEAGHHASMHYLARNVPVRLDARTRFPWAESAIAILVPYAAERPAAPEGSLSRHIARYALGDDYHEVLDRILRELEAVIAHTAAGAKTWRYVDTGPLSDRGIAASAGLGWIGKNGMLIDEHDGSYFFIGTLLTSLECDAPAPEVADRCGSCTRCIDACPTDAILPGRLVDSARCISYATIEHRGPLDPDVARHLDGNAFGCDICQEVCPWNERPPEPHPAFLPRKRYGATPITDLLRMDQAAFSSLFQRSAVKRAKLAGMKRNVSAMLDREE